MNALISQAIHTFLQESLREVSRCFEVSREGLRTRANATDTYLPLIKRAHAAKTTDPAYKNVPVVEVETQSERHIESE
jgi:hypothetical protein